jgi:hypothetical protein
MAPAGQYTGIFTRVGKIELDTAGTRLIDTSTGRATVPSTISSSLHIPQYQDAPFGGNLFLFGAFSQDIYTPTPAQLLPGFSEVYYKIKIDNLDTSTSEYLHDPLEKTKYTVNFTTGSVNTDRIKLGPTDAGGLPGCVDATSQPVCYKLTPLSSGSNVFWSFPDLIALWRTGGISGKHRLSLEVVGFSPVFTTINDFTYLNLHLDNEPPIARIDPLQTGEPDSPRVYTPNPANAGIGGDLASTLLGTFPADYGGTVDPTCSILNLEGPVGQKYLTFKLTAHHPKGFLRYWDFKYRRNDGGYQTHIGKNYASGSMVDSGSPQVSSSESNTTGFQDKYLYLNSGFLQPGGGTSLGSCAYRFVIRAGTRTTDGYHYLFHRSDEDMHYIQR